jgi:hypothetical protein
MYFESKHEKNIAPNHCDPDRIDPFQLSVHKLASTVGIALLLGGCQLIAPAMRVFTLLLTLRLD